MKSKTSSTLFLSAVAAGIALASAVAAPAYAQTAAVDEAEPVCVDGICYALPAQPVEVDALEIDTDGFTPAPAVSPAVSDGSDLEVFTRDDVSYQSSTASTVVGSDIGGMDTVIGSVDRTAPPTLADGYLDGDTLLPDNSEIVPVENVTGIGLKSTF